MRSLKFPLLLAAGALSLAQAADGEHGNHNGNNAQEYSHALPVTVPGQDGIAMLTLPTEVYLHARSAELDDMRLFDADGKTLPFAFYRPAPPTRSETVTLRAKAFALYGNTEPAQGALGFDIKTDAQGRVAEVKLKPNAPGDSNHATDGMQALLLDFGLTDKESAPLIDTLQINMPPEQDNYSSQIWLSVSNDLQKWDTLAVADVRWLRNAQGERLVQDKITFEPTRFRYARLSWNNGKAQLLGAISASGAQSMSLPQPESSLLLEAKPGHFAQDLLYESAVALPVDKLNLDFDNANLVLPLQLGSYRLLPAVPGQVQQWQFQPLTSSVFYQIRQGGQLRRNGALHIIPTHADQWVLRAQDANGFGANRPRLRINWQPAQLIFLRSGKPPYKLAFGRNQTKSGASDLAQVAPGFSEAELAQVQTGQFGALQVNPQASSATGDEQVAQAQASARRRTYLLWAVLLGGVAIMAIMVAKLMRQMRQEPASEPRNEDTPQN